MQKKVEMKWVEKKGDKGKDMEKSLNKEETNGDNSFQTPRKVMSPPMNNNVKQAKQLKSNPFAILEVESQGDSDMDDFEEEVPSSPLIKGKHEDLMEKKKDTVNFIFNNKQRHAEPVIVAETPLMVVPHRKQFRKFDTKIASDNGRDDGVPSLLSTSPKVPPFTLKYKRRYSMGVRKSLMNLSPGAKKPNIDSGDDFSDEEGSPTLRGGDAFFADATSPGTLIQPVEEEGHFEGGEAPLSPNGWEEEVSKDVNEEDGKLAKILDQRENHPGGGEEDVFIVVYDE